MTNLPLIVPIALSVMALILFVFGGFAFIALMKGCLVLRRLARTSSLDDMAILLKSPLVPAVSVVAAATRLTPEAREYVRRLIELHFGVHELVLVLDGPEQADFDAWVREFRLAPSPRIATGSLSCARIRGIYESRDPIHLVVVHKERGGEADSLNAGVNVASSPVIGLVDPEADFEPIVLLRLIRPMLEDPERTIAVCGIAPPVPADSFAGRIGALEWLRIWLSRGAAFSGWNVLAPVPGSSALARRDAIQQAGGFCAGRMELLLHLHGTARNTRKEYCVALVPDPVSRPRAPQSFADLCAMDVRDQRDVARSWRNRKRIARGGQAIRWGLPALVSARFLRPLLETTAWILAGAGLAAGWIDLPMVGVVLLATCGIGMVLSMGALVFRELTSFEGSDPSRLALMFLTTIPENIGYRQIRNLWLLGGFFRRA